MQLVVGQVNLTAYRPQQKVSNSGFPFFRKLPFFKKTPVPDDLETDFSYGPTIRLNGRIQSDDKDLIEVKVVVTSDARMVLDYPPSFRVFRDKNLNGDPLEAKVYEPGALPDTLWVEHINDGITFTPVHYGLSVYPEGGSPQSGDHLVFQRLTTGVLLFMGANQEPNDPPNPGQTFCSIAIELYNNGYDVHMLNEDYDEDNEDLILIEVGDGFGEGPGWKVAEKWRADNNIANFTLLGYSRGGGSVFDFATEAADEGLNVIFSAYLDGVTESALWRQKDEDGDFMIRAVGVQTKPPPATQKHRHFYQIPCTYPEDRVVPLVTQLPITASGLPLDVEDDPDTPEDERGVHLTTIDRHGNADEYHPAKQEIINAIMPDDTNDTLPR